MAYICLLDCLQLCNYLWNNKDNNDMMITKELAFVYIVNGKKFLKKEDAVNYMNKVKEKKSQGDVK